MRSLLRFTERRLFWANLLFLGEAPTGSFGRFGDRGDPNRDPVGGEEVAHLAKSFVPAELEAPKVCPAVGGVALGPAPNRHRHRDAERVAQLPREVLQRLPR
jgi:hypothetical protein